MSAATLQQPPPVAGKADPAWPKVIARAEAYRPSDPYTLATLNQADWDRLIADMKERNEEGIRKYGIALCAFNGRDQLTDLYQEILDACVYAQASLDETDDSDIEFYCDLLVRMACNVRNTIERRKRR